MPHPSVCRRARFSQGTFHRCAGLFNATGRGNLAGGDERGGNILTGSGPTLKHLAAMTVTLAICTVDLSGGTEATPSIN